jgi:DNA-binding response OmpR family regulator
MPDQVQRARDAGFDDYWTKPVDFALLRRRLGSLLRR